jgi:hypothetical protein
MRPHSPRLTTGHPWGRTGGADSDTSPDRRGESQPLAAWSAPGPARRASYEPQPLRERLKPIVDELQDTLEGVEGTPSPEDYRWLRGQLRRLVDRLDMP